MDLKAESIKVNSKAKLTFHPLTQGLHRSLSNAYSDNKQNEYLINMMAHFENIQTYVPQIGIISNVKNSTKSYQIITGCFTPLFDLNSMSQKQILFIRYSKARNNNKKAYKLTDEAFRQAIIDLIYSDFINQLSILSLKKVGLLTEDLRKLSQDYPSNIWRDFDNKHSAKIASQKFVSDLAAMSRDTLLKHIKSNF